MNMGHKLGQSLIKLNCQSNQGVWGISRYELMKAQSVIESWVDSKVGQR
jgi:hypothetical protein